MLKDIEPFINLFSNSILCEEFIASDLVISLTISVCSIFGASELLTICLLVSWLSLISINPDKSIDLYYSNALSTHDLGQILKSEDYKYGIRLNLLNF